MSENYNYYLYKQTQELKDFVHAIKKSLNCSPQFYREVSERGCYAAMQTNDYSRLCVRYGENVARTQVIAYQGLVTEIVANRKFLAQRENFSCLDNEKELTKSIGREYLSLAFPSLNWHVDVMSDIGFEERKSYYGDNTVNLKLSWNTKVSKKQIATVNAGDGMRFILDATERHIERLNEIGIRAYSAAALHVKHKKLSIENAWVMTYERDGNKAIKAIHKEFSRAESLINRRIKDEVVGLLLD